MNLIPIGIAVIVVGFLLVFIGMLLHSFGGQQAKGDSKFSVAGFIGPFPFGFGNDRQLLTFTLFVAIALFLIVMLLFNRGAR